MHPRRCKLEVALFVSLVTASVFIIILFFFYVLQDEIWQDTEYCRDFCTSERAQKVAEDIEKCEKATGGEKEKEKLFENPPNVSATTDSDLNDINYPTEDPNDSNNPTEDPNDVNNPTDLLPDNNVSQIPKNNSENTSDDPSGRLERLKAGPDKNYFSRIYRCSLEPTSYAMLVEKLYFDENDYLFRCIVAIMSSKIVVASTACGISSKSNFRHWAVRIDSLFWSTGGSLHPIESVESMTGNNSTIILILLRLPLHQECFTPLQMRVHHIQPVFKLYGFRNHDIYSPLDKREKYAEVNEFSFAFLIQKGEGDPKFSDCEVYKSKVPASAYLGLSLTCGFLNGTDNDCHLKFVSPIIGADLTLYGMTIGTYCDKELGKSIYFLEKLEELHITWSQKYLNLLVLE